MKNKSKKMKRNTKKKKYNTKIPEGKIVIILLIIIVVLSIIPNIYTLIYNMVYGKGTEFKEVVIKDNKSIKYSEELLNTISKTSDENIALSDLSINPSLAYFYSLSNNEASNEFNNYFGVDVATLKDNYNKINERYKDAYKVINYTNSIWINKDANNFNLTSKAKSELKDFNFEANNISFSSDLNKINKYIQKNTHNTIKGIELKDLNDVDSILLGTVYFNEEWENNIRGKDVVAKTFKGTKGDKDVSFLTSKDEKYLHSNNARGFMKRYKTNDLYFVGILPNEGVSFDQVNINDLLNSYGKCDVEFPEFEFEYDFDMSPVLKTLGINKIFNEGSLDGFYKGAYVKKVFQKNYIKVNRKGTEAVSVAETHTSSFGVTTEGEPIKLIIDRPFMFLIYDQSINQVLFIGRVNNI